MRQILSRDRWNFWDSYSDDDESLGRDRHGGRIHLFKIARPRDAAHVSNILRAGELNNGERTVKLLRWYARADHPISLEVLSRTVVTLTMGSAWMRDIPMDHLFIRNDVSGELGEKLDVVLPIRQYMAVEVIPAPKSTRSAGRIWIHFEVTPHHEER